jgi:predicted nucleotidyltransferase
MSGAQLLNVEALVGGRAPRELQVRSRCSTVASEQDGLTDRSALRRTVQNKPGRRVWEDEGRRVGSWPALDRPQLAAAAEALAAAFPGVEAVYLFGSRARGQASAASDVDVAVRLERPALVTERIGTQEEMARFLEKRLHAPVDVVLLHADLSPGLLFDIFVIETILYARDKERAHRVAGRARSV